MFLLIILNVPPTKEGLIHPIDSTRLTEFGQALQLESVQRANGDANLRQYVDDNFVHAKKCVAAQDITPAVGLWPFGTPSFAQPAVAPFPPFGYPFPPFGPVPPVAGSTGSSSSAPEVTNG